MRINLTDKIFCEQCPCCPWTWDLYQVQIATRKGVEQRVEKPLGIYGMPLAYIVKDIADIHLCLEENKALEMKEYIEEFKKIQKQASENIKESINKFKELKQNGII